MPAQNLEQLFETLVRERAEIRATLLSLQDSSQPVELDQSTQGRLSRIDAMTQQSMAMAGTTRLNIQLQRIEAALARFEAKQYGICCGCRQKINPARLRADPATPFCMDCTAEMDQDKLDDMRRDAGP